MTFVGVVGVALVLLHQLAALSALLRQAAEFDEVPLDTIAGAAKLCSDSVATRAQTPTRGERLELQTRGATCVVGPD